MSSMINISPLASRKGGKYDSPKPRYMPTLGESPAAKDAVERELMEDEDLSVLLQLASHSNTPRKKEGRYVWNFGEVFVLLSPVSNNGNRSYSSILETVMFSVHCEEEKVQATAILRCNCQ